MEMWESSISSGGRRREEQWGQALVQASQRSGGVTVTGGGQELLETWHWGTWLSGMVGMG